MPAGVLRAHAGRALLPGRRCCRGRRLPCGQGRTPPSPRIWTTSREGDRRLRHLRIDGYVHAGLPEVFEVRSDGYLYVLQEEPAAEVQDKVASRRPLPDGRHHARGMTGSTPPGKAWASSGSMLCVGLDPDPAQLPGRSTRWCRPTRRRRSSGSASPSSTPPPTWCARSSRRSPTSPPSAPRGRWKRCAATSASVTPTCRWCSTPSAVTSARRPSSTPRRRSGATAPTP